MAYFIRTNPHQTTIVPVENSVRGVYGGAPYFDQNLADVRRSWNVKADTYGTHNHSEPTFWSRNWGNVTEEPLIARRFEMRDGKVHLDVIDTFYTSRNLPDPYAWAPSDELYQRAGNQVNKVDTKLLLKLAEMRDGVRAQFGASLVEARTTLDMLAGAVIPPVKALLALRKGNIEEMLKQLGLTRKNINPRKAAELWLQYQYGWKPMLSDIYSLNQMLQKPLAEPLLLTCRTSETLLVESRTNALHRIETVKSGIGVKCQYIPSGLSDLDAKGLLNPLSVIWEAVPFSFVVDWFVPLGNTFQALTATADLRFISGYRNSKIIDRSIHYHDGFAGQIVQQQGKVHIRRGMFNRIPMQNFPTPKIYADETPFSTPRVQNAAALLTQLFTGR
jgi:hypothetical protein